MGNKKSNMKKEFYRNNWLQQKRKDRTNLTQKSRKKEITMSRNKWNRVWKTQKLKEELGFCKDKGDKPLAG